MQAGKTQADLLTGRQLMELVNSVPKINAEDFEEMLNSNMKVRLQIIDLAACTRMNNSTVKKHGFSWKEHVMCFI